jgi:hypothetical protein
LFGVSVRAFSAWKQSRQKKGKGRGGLAEMKVPGVSRLDEMMAGLTGVVRNSFCPESLFFTTKPDRRRWLFGQFLLTF